MWWLILMIALGLAACAVMFYVGMKAPKMGTVYKMLKEAEVFGLEIPAHDPIVAINSGDKVAHKTLSRVKYDAEKEGLKRIEEQINKIY